VVAGRRGENLPLALVYNLTRRTSNVKSVRLTLRCSSVRVSCKILQQDPCHEDRALQYASLLRWYCNLHDISHIAKPRGEVQTFAVVQRVAAPEACHFISRNLLHFEPVSFCLVALELHQSVLHSRYTEWIPSPKRPRMGEK